MAVKNRPGVPVNVERTTKSTEKRSVFLDIKPGQTVNLRFTPVSEGQDGQLFFISAQHYKLKENGQARTFACLNNHSPDKEICPACEALERAPGILGKDTAEKLSDLHGVSYRWHAQVVPVPKEGQEKPDQTYIVGLSKMTADDVSKILKMEKDNRQTLLVDPDQGQAIQISRNNATGFATRYKVLPTGIRLSLDDLLPGWESKFLTVATDINLRIKTRAEFLAALQETLGVGVFAQLFPDEK